ncbi:MAG: MFS transporter [Rhodobacteraceae bacterium]|nr:MFS transporter [Paracoccaceae bacterium]
MKPRTDPTAAARNVALYPWFRFFQNLIFWQAVWFLFFQAELSPAEAILLYTIYDLGTAALEVPSGYMSDRLGRRGTLIAAAVAGCAGCLLLTLGDGFAIFAVAQLLLGTAAAFASGTDSAMLYESLQQTGRTDEVEDQELRAWRFGFAGLAVSAIGGGAMAMIDLRLPFGASAAAFACVIAISLALGEPDVPQSDTRRPTLRRAAQGLRADLLQPVLGWLFALSVLMYGYSHLPFIFGQPFMLSALAQVGLAGETPLISGAVAATMMAVSVATSLAAPALRHRMGLAGILLAAFGLQILLAACLALSNAPVVIAMLFLRMVPDSLSRPFILARIQPLVHAATRATYLSLQSLCARLAFAASLLAVAGSLPGASALAHADIARILGIYSAVGVLCLAGLALWAHRHPPEPPRETPAPG